MTAFSGSKRLVLHVGHGKTGSSALQSAFALSTAELEANGVHYPEGPEHEAAAAGQITSGNGGASTLLERARAGLQRPQDTVLLSNENLFMDLMRDPALIEGLRDLGARIEIVLFIRNPLGHAISAYGQAVKRKGSTRMPGPMLGRYRVPSRVELFLDLAEQNGLMLHVLNYSNHARDVRGAFCRALGLPAGLLKAPPRTRVNRSLTRAELQMQRAFNEAWGSESAEFVSDAWCNALPDIPSEVPFVNRKGYQRFVRLQTPVINRVNARLPEGERYAIEGYEEFWGASDQAEGAEDRFGFSADQLDVLARSLTQRIKMPQAAEEVAALALSAEANRRLSQDEIERLIAVAIQLRGAAGQDVTDLRRRRRALRGSEAMRRHRWPAALDGLVAALDRFRRNAAPAAGSKDN